jgi:hypothetical protein
MGSLGVSPLTGIGYDQDHYILRSRNLTFNDGVSWLRGNHSFRIGGEITRFGYPVDFCSNECNGAYSFSSLERFLANRPRSFAAMFIRPESHPSWVQWLFASYIQDNYKVFDSLTLNLGLRYELATVPEEEHGRSSALRDFYDPAVTVGPLFSGLPRKSFSPRFGFAWAPMARSTSIRGGFGVFYDHVLMYTMRAMLDQIEPFSRTGNFTDTTESILRFPDAYATQLDLLSSQTIPTTGPYEPDSTYIYRWSLMLQQQLGTGWVTSAGYTGSRGLHLWAHYTPNVNKWLGWPEEPTGPKFWPAIDSPDFRGPIKPDFGSAWRHNASQANSYYHGLELSLQKQMSRGLQFQVAYTFSKTIDQSADVTNAEFEEGQRFMYFWDTGMARSLSSQHLKNSFVSNFTYEIPFARESNGVVGALARGWRVNGVVTLLGGNPRTVSGGTTENSNRMGSASGLRADLVGGNNNPTSGTSAGCTQGSGSTSRVIPAGAELGGPDLYYDPCPFTPARPGFYGNLGRNTVIGPGNAVVDFSLSKNFNLTESSRLQFRSEFFNALNHPNLGDPDMGPFDNRGRPDLAGGTITTSKGTARQIQFALKFIF